MIRKTISSFLVFVFLLAVPPLVLMYIGNADLLVQHFWGLFAFICGLTFLAVIFVLLMQKKNPDSYSQAFLGATVFKLLACLIFIVVFIKKVPHDKVIMVADFAYLYFLNTAFEIYGLLRNLRNQNLR
jgi:F0F1-type ATP synthase assembly protein I